MFLNIYKKLIIDYSKFTLAIVFSVICIALYFSKNFNLDASSDALLLELYIHMVQEKFIYRHKWESEMLIMWDNRTVMHMAEGGYDGHERLLHRITIAGDKTE